MTNNYSVWKHKDEAGSCALSPIQGFERTFRLKNGAPLAAVFPDGVYFQMDPDYPDDRELQDNLLNLNMLLVVSEAIQNHIKALQIPDVEFLPVKILDHHGRVASQTYAILHPLDPLDAINLERSRFKIDVTDPEVIDTIQYLELREDQIPEHKKIFKLMRFRDIHLVHCSLVKELANQGFTGIEWIGVPEYSTL